MRTEIQPKLDFDRPLPFDAVASQEAKQAGMDQAAERKKGLLKYARRLAIELGKKMAEVSADDVQKALYDKGINIHALGNSAGSLFVGKQWEWTGRRIKSVRVHSHGNEIKTWRLKING